MPANLNPQYYAAEERYKQAKDDREMLKALKEMLAIIPKHKGTEKLQADIKRKIAHAKENQQTKKSKGPKRFSYHVEKEGAGQIGVIGPPNTGKSQLVNSLAQVSFETAPYPFTTRIFQPAMMPFEDIKIQLIDLPPFSKEHMENWVPSLVKNCDAILLVFDFGSDDLLDQVEATLDLLHLHKIEIENKTGALEDDPRWKLLKTILAGNKMDISAANDNFAIFKEFYKDRFFVIPVSAKEHLALDNLKYAIFKLLNIVRIYSKRPGHEPDYDKPFILPAGKTVYDFACSVHQDFAQNLKFARVWGKSTFEGQRVTKEHVLEDKDVVELHE